MYFLVSSRIGLSFIIFSYTKFECLKSEAVAIIEFYGIYHIRYHRGWHYATYVKNLEMILQLLSFQKLMFDKMILSRSTWMGQFVLF